MAAFDNIDVQEEINKLVNSLSETEGKISDAMERSKSLLDELLKKEEHLAECSLLYSQYNSLKSQYTADVKRLSFIVEGESSMRQIPHDPQCPCYNGQLPAKQQKSCTEASRVELSRRVPQLSGSNESEEEIEQQTKELHREVFILMKILKK